MSLWRLLALSTVLGLAVPAVGETPAAPGAALSPLAGGPPVYPYKSIAQNAAGSANHTRLMAAMRAAGLVETLEGPGPFTVFAPTDEAFAKLPSGTIAALQTPRERSRLIKLVTYHIVPGKLTGARIRSAILAGGGVATLTTVAGEPLTASLYDDQIVLTDVRGGASTITIGNVVQSNGLIHVVDAVLIP